MRRNYVKLLPLLLLPCLFAADVPAQDIPRSPTENIVSVEIWDEIDRGQTVIHVTWYAEAPSGASEVDGWMEDSLFSQYPLAVHPDQTNEFHVDHGFGSERTGETIDLAVWCSMDIIRRTDRAPNTCFFPYEFGTGTEANPVTFDDTDDWAVEPKVNILDVHVDDEVVGNSTVLNVTFYTEAVSGPEVMGRLDWWGDGRQNSSDATHPSGTNEFHVSHDLGEDKTGETIRLAAFANCHVEMPGDRAPNIGFFEYTFGTGPQTFTDDPEGPPFPPGVDIRPVHSVWDGIPMINWLDEVTFSYQGDSTVTGVDIKIEVEGTVAVNNEAMDNPSGNYYEYKWTAYPLHGQALVTYTVHRDTGGDLVLEIPVLIDPSGVVFDTLSGDPIQGATVTLYYSATGDAGSFVQLDPTLSGAAHPLVDPKVNPQTTNSIGGYGWDVEGGFQWYVHVDANGYHAKDSRIVEVPPPVTDLNVGLDPLSPKEMEEKALAQLKSVEGAEKAVAALEKGLAAELWVDGYHLGTKGKKAFNAAKKCIKKLKRMADEAGVASAIGLLVDAGAGLAKTALDDAVAAGGNEKKIAKSQKQMGKATEQLDKGRSDKAVVRYKKAWASAQKAVK
ncbi:MAG: hypothetical protein ACYTDY_10240 [Planctomycetota bacterium]